MSYARFGKSNLSNKTNVYVLKKFLKFNPYKHFDTIYEWDFYVNTVSSYYLTFGPFVTVFESRHNSNIYKNIFETILLDLYHIEQVYGNNEIYNQTSEIFQYNHEFSLYDIVYINQNNIYEKALANQYKYNAVGIVTKIIDENTFELTTYGQIDYNINLTSDSGILYLSDSINGKLCKYEDITTKFYTPVGFYTGDKIIFSILDSSYGDTLKKYQDSLFGTELISFNNNDIQDVIQEVLNNA